jgi:hypothetical protein
MRTELRSIVVALAIPFSGGPADAQPLTDERDLSFEASVPRYALVFANETYPTDRLRSAARDADVMQRKLEALHFKVVVERNRSASQIKASINGLRTREVRFARNQDLRPVVVIYFSGHGFEVNGTHYLAGIYAGDTSNPNPQRESLELRFIEDSLAREAYLIVLVDACRVELAGDGQDLPSEVSVRGASQQTDFALNEDIPADQTPASSYDDPGPDSPELVLGRATWSGDTAAAQDDNDTEVIRPSVYTEALDNALGQIEQEIIYDLIAAKDYVDARYGDLKQYPYQEGDIKISLLDSSDRAAKREADWEAVKSAPTRQSINKHLRRFPESPHVAAARRWLARPHSE